MVHHETGHAIVDKHLGTKTCDGSAAEPCTEAVLEHWGVDEGISMILQKVVGKGSVGSAPEDSLDEIMDDDGCEITEYDPKGAADCAHNIGRLLVESFDGVVEELEEKFPDAEDPAAVARHKALAIYTKAVAEFEHLDRFREHVTFQSLLLNLVKAAAEHAGAIFKQFRDIGVTLPLPTTPTTRGEELPGGDSLPGVEVPPAPWWFDNPTLFRCSVSRGVEYKVTCVRRNNDTPRD